MKTSFIRELIFSLRMIPGVIPVAIFLNMLTSCGTSNRMHARQANQVKSTDTLLLDSEGNRYNLKLFSDSNLWMTTNLRLNIPTSYCYDEIEKNCEGYGRLYSWESALKGCKLLGEGWRLPTNEDWQKMAKQFGGVRDDSEDKGNAAYNALLYGGIASFNAVLGGGRDPGGKYARLDAHGFYWTATETGSGTAWFYNFGKGSLMLNRHNDGEKTRAFSVRCIKSCAMNK